MKQNRTKTIVIISSIFFGVVIGLILASNLDLMQNGFAGSNSETVSAPPASSTTGAPPNDLAITSKAFVDVAKRVIPAVVSITSEKVVKVQDPFSQFFRDDDFFRRFFRSPNGGEREYRQNGLGSGVIVSPDGYILTNYHVIKDADEIAVVIDKDEISAEIIGKDPATDLAVIKIDRNNLPAITFGNSDQLEVGEWVLAVGSPFNLGLEHTVTSGIVSAKGRSLNLSRELTYQDFIQTDAAINPGNSGGALININGELVGINTAIYSGNAGGNIGIGFAIPVNLAKNVMDDLISSGKVVRGFLGVVIGPLDAELAQALKIKDKKGAVVVEVQEGMPAADAGLRKYDVIVEVDGKKIEDNRMLVNMIAAYNPGKSINLRFIRDGEMKTTKVTLTERPTDDVASVGKPSSVLGKLGIEVTELNDRLAERYGYDEQEGVLVTQVLRGSVAADKGLQAGDLIMEVNRKKVSSVLELSKRLDNLNEGDIILLQVRNQRGNQFLAMKVPK